MAVLNFPKVSPFCQIRKALGRLLSESVDSYLPPAQNNCYAKVAYCRVAGSDFLQLPLVGPDLEAGVIDPVLTDLGRLLQRLWVRVFVSSVVWPHLFVCSVSQTLYRGI